MRYPQRTELPIPPEHVSLEDAFNETFAALERAEQIAKGLKPEAWVEVQRESFSPLVLDLPVHRLERPLPTFNRGKLMEPQENSKAAPADGKLTVLTAPSRDALEWQDQARARIEHLMREDLAAGNLRAFAYLPGDLRFGEVADRTSWAASSVFPGLETFVDPDTSPGPSVGGSPVFLERKAFKKWLATTVRSRRDPRIHSGKRGRPSEIPLVLAEHRRRCFERTAKASVPEEAKALRAWFEGEHPIAKAPALKTIRDALRRPF